MEVFQSCSDGLRVAYKEEGGGREQGGSSSGGETLEEREEKGELEREMEKGRRGGEEREQAD